MFDLIQLLVNIKKEYSLVHFNRDRGERERDTQKSWTRQAVPSTSEIKQRRYVTLCPKNYTFH